MGLEVAAEFLNKAVKQVLVGGPKMRVAKTYKSFVEIAESADAYMFAGPIFNDYSSVSYSLLLKKEKAIIVQPEPVPFSINS